MDLWAGEELLRLKKQSGYQDLRLHLALPFEGHDLNWDAAQKKRMAVLRDACASVAIVGQGELPAVLYKRRNYYMVDHADILLAVYDNDRSSSAAGRG